MDNKQSNNDMDKFVKDYCKKHGLDLYELTDQQTDRICNVWAMKSIGIEFKTLEEWKKEDNLK